MPDAEAFGSNNPFQLEAQVAVVTGAASGIGLAVVEVLAGAGEQVVLGDLDVAGAEAAAERIRERRGDAIGPGVVIAERGEVDALVDAALSLGKRLDVMCNVAGIPSDGPLDELGETELDRVVAINVKGTLFGCQAAVRAVTPRGGGSIDQARFDGFVSAMQAQSPLGIVGEAIDQAWLILYLASAVSRFCTGQVWRANGGAVLPR
jgi:3-oxoacyl-[acyl-carrier protein] reductase